MQSFRQIGDGREIIGWFDMELPTDNVTEAGRYPRRYRTQKVYEDFVC